MLDDARWIRVQMWKPVREVFERAAELFEDAERLRGASEAEVSPPVPARGRGAPPPAGAPASYLRRRTALHEAIESQLDPVLTDHLGPWQKHVCVLAIVSFIDERERVALGGLGDAWQLPLLQTAFVDIDDGGDRFFTQLHELLGRADVHRMVFEIHLLCLRAGFVGRYRDRRHELDKLTGWLAERLRHYRAARTSPGMPALPPPPSTGRRVGFVQLPVRYYVGVAVLVVLVFATLRIVSSRAVEHSNLADYCHYHGSDAP
jgi:type IV/VI secretion system ImpK/VasF family protein